MHIDGGRNLETHILPEMFSFLYTKGFGIESGYVLQVIQTVSKRGQQGRKGITLFFVFDLVVHTQTQIQFSRRQKGRFHVVSIGLVIVQKLSGKIDRCRVVKILDCSYTQFTGSLELVVADIHLTQAVVGYSIESQFDINKIIELYTFFVVVFGYPVEGRQGRHIAHTSAGPSWGIRTSVSTGWINGP